MLAWDHSEALGEEVERRGHRSKEGNPPPLRGAFGGCSLHRGAQLRALKALPATMPLVKLRARLCPLEGSFFYMSGLWWPDSILSLGRASDTREPGLSPAPWPGKCSQSPPLLLCRGFPRGRTTGAVKHESLPHLRPGLQAPLPPSSTPVSSPRPLGSLPRPDPRKRCLSLPSIPLQGTFMGAWWLSPVDTVQP